MREAAPPEPSHLGACAQPLRRASVTGFGKGIASRGQRAGTTTRRAQGTGVLCLAAPLPNCTRCPTRSHVLRPLRRRRRSCHPLPRPRSGAGCRGTPPAAPGMHRPPAPCGASGGCLITSQSPLLRRAMALAPWPLCIPLPPPPVNMYSSAGGGGLARNLPPPLPFSFQTLQCIASFANDSASVLFVISPYSSQLSLGLTPHSLLRGPAVHCKRHGTLFSQKCVFHPLAGMPGGPWECHGHDSQSILHHTIPHCTRRFTCFGTTSWS